VKGEVEEKVVCKVCLQLATKGLRG
jgi:hypothetical protein